MATSSNGGGGDDNVETRTAAATTAAGGATGRRSSSRSSRRRNRRLLHPRRLLRGLPRRKHGGPSSSSSPAAAPSGGGAVSTSADGASSSSSSSSELYDLAYSRRYADVCARVADGSRSDEQEDASAASYASPVFNGGGGNSALHVVCGWGGARNRGTSHSDDDEREGNDERRRRQRRRDEDSPLRAILTLTLAHPPSTLVRNASGMTPLHLLSWWGLPDDEGDFGESAATAAEILMSGSELAKAKMSTTTRGGGLIMEGHEVEEGKDRRIANRSGTKRRRRKERRRWRGLCGSVDENDIAPSGSEAPTLPPTPSLEGMSQGAAKTEEEMPSSSFSSVLHVPDAYGRTPLHLALLTPVARHSPSYVETLLRRDPDSRNSLLRPDSAGRTPLAIFASRHGGSGGGALRMIWQERRREARRRRREEKLRREERERGWATFEDWNAEQAEARGTESSLAEARGAAMAAGRALVQQRRKGMPSSLAVEENGGGGPVGSCRYLSSIWETAELLLRAAHYGGRRRGYSVSGGADADGCDGHGPNGGRRRRCTLHAAAALYVSGSLSVPSSSRPADDADAGGPGELERGNHTAEEEGGGKDLWRLALDVRGVLDVGTRDANGDYPLHAALRALSSAPNDDEGGGGRRRRRTTDRRAKLRRCLQVTRALLGVRPEAAREEDGEGRLPLSIALGALRDGGVDPREQARESEGIGGCGEVPSSLFDPAERSLLDLLFLSNPGALDDVADEKKKGGGGGCVDGERRNGREGVYPHLLARYGRRRRRRGGSRDNRRRRRRHRRYDPDSSSSSSSDDDDDRDEEDGDNDEEEDCSARISGGRSGSGAGDDGFERGAAGDAGGGPGGLGAVYRVLRERPSLMSGGGAADATAASSSRPRDLQHRGCIPRAEAQLSLSKSDGDGDCDVAQSSSLEIV